MILSGIVILAIKYAENEPKGGKISGHMRTKYQNGQQSFSTQKKTACRIFPDAKKRDAYLKIISQVFGG